MALSFVLAALAATSDAGLNDPVVKVRLEAGPVMNGLQQLALLSGQPLAARPADVVNRRSRRLNGTMRLSTALDRLCAPAGLRCRLISAGITVTLAPVQGAVRKVARPVSVPSTSSALEAAPAIIVTGRAGVNEQKRTELSYSASRKDNAELRRRLPTSLAELLTDMPGIWIDTSAGISANTARVRGIPLDGYQALAIEEDGLPVQHDNLPWTDIDQFVRPDIMTRSVEYVRGGPSAIFATNAPGGLLNMRIREPADEAGGELRLMASDYGLARIDAYVTGPVGGGWRMIAGGFVSRDPTVRSVQRVLGGGQLRLRADHGVGDGGLFSVNLRLLDDDTLNVSSYPLLRTEGRIAALPGFAPLTGSWFGPDLDRVDFALRNGVETRPVGRNNHNRLIAPSASLTLPIDGAMRLSAQLRVRRSDTERYSILSGGAPIDADSYAAGMLPGLAAAFPGTASVALRRTTTGEAFTPLTGNDLVATVQPVAADVKLVERIGEISLSHRFRAWGEHDLTLGLYDAGYRWRYRRVVARALVEARSQPHLLDVVALGADGTPLGRTTDAGFLSRASTFEHINSRNHITALYLADEWKLTPELRLDLGIRREHARLRGKVEQRATIDDDDPETLADDAVVKGTGVYTPFDDSFDGTALTAAIDWHPVPGLGAFARVTRGMRFPDPGLYRDDPAPSDVRTLHILQGEMGMVHEGRRLSFNATLFGSWFDDVDVDDASLDPVTGAILRRQITARVRTVGLEVEGRWRPRAWLSFAFTGTLQDPRFRDYRFSRIENGVPVAVSYDGNLPRRLPRTMTTLTTTATIPGSALTLDASWRTMGRRYADDANSLALPAFGIVDLGATWNAPRDLSFRLRVTNLTNRIAVMQGDAIAGEVSARPGSDGIFTGRTLAGRTVEIAATLRF